AAQEMVSPDREGRPIRWSESGRFVPARAAPALWARFAGSDSAELRQPEERPVSRSPGQFLWRCRRPGLMGLFHGGEELQFLRGCFGDTWATGWRHRPAD